MTRTDDIINVAAHRLSTGEIEEVLAAHPDVAECAVIGVADALKGQVPLAFSCSKPGSDARRRRSSAKSSTWFASASARSRTSRRRSSSPACRRRAQGTNRYIHDKTSPYYQGPDSHGRIGHRGASFQPQGYGDSNSVSLNQPQGSGGSNSVRSNPPERHRDSNSVSLCPSPFRMTERDGCQAAR
jgi:AMP-binding enzyme C-terminal domain